MAVDPTAEVHASAEVEEPCSIGPRTRVWRFAHVMAGARIGADCTLGQGVFVAAGVVLGSRVKVQNQVSLYEGVELEDDVFVGPSCVFTNVKNPRAAISRRAEFKPTRVKRGATLGANATLVCGITVGQYAFVGAGAVVTRDVPDHALVLGVPARRQGWVSRSGARLAPQPDGRWRCPETGEWYEETATGAVRLAAQSEARAGA